MDARKFLIRYWFVFNRKDVTLQLSHGCGVTAYDYDDAISILIEVVFDGHEIPEIMIEVENIDIRSLDQNHIVTNITDPTMRGVWYPQGYRKLK